MDQEGLGILIEVREELQNEVHEEERDGVWIADVVHDRVQDDLLELRVALYEEFVDELVGLVKDDLLVLGLVGI